MVRRSWVAGPVLVVVLLAGCDRESQDSILALPTATSVPTTTTSAPMTTSTAATANTTEPTTTMIVEVSELIADRYPPEDSPDWETWTVFVFVSPASEYFESSAALAAHDEVRAHAISLGYDPERMGVFDLGCSPGTDEALGLDTEVNYVVDAFFFNSEAAAQAVAEAFEPFTVGYGYFYIGCAD